MDIIYYAESYNQKSNRILHSSDRPCINALIKKQHICIKIATVRPAEYQYALYMMLNIQREKAGSNRHTPLRQSGTLPIMLFSLFLLLLGTLIYRMRPIKLANQ